MHETRETAMDREHLAAFVDGELSPEEAAAVVMHLADHPGDQAFVDDLFAANAALAQAFSAPMSAEVPAAIRAAILGGGDGGGDGRGDGGGRVVALRPRRRMPLVWGGMAAAAVVAGVLLPGLLTPVGPGPAPGPLAAADPVAQMLEQQPSGSPIALGGGREAMVLASFALPGGVFCREIEMIDPPAGRIDYAVACREGDGWDVRITLAEAADQAGGGFVTANGDEADALIRLLQDGAAARPLDPRAEAAAMAAGWRQP